MQYRIRRIQSSTQGGRGVQYPAQPLMRQIHPLSQSNARRILQAGWSHKQRRQKSQEGPGWPRLVEKGQDGGSGTRKPGRRPARLSENLAEIRSTRPREATSSGVIPHVPRQTVPWAVGARASPVGVSGGGGYGGLAQDGHASKSGSVSRPLFSILSSPGFRST